jgi:cytochrome P450
VDEWYIPVQIETGHERVRGGKVIDRKSPSTNPRHGGESTATIARQLDGPPGLPLIGNVIQFKRDPLKLLDDVRTHGNLVRLRFGPKTAYVVNDPELIEDLLATHHRSFMKTSGRRFNRLSRFLARGDDVERVINFPADADGEFWSRERPILQSSFTHTQVSRYLDTMISVIRDLVADWKSGEVRDIYHDMVLLTFRIVARALFGTDDPNEEKKLLDAFEIIMAAVVTRIANPFQLPVIVPTAANRRLVRSVREINSTFDAIVQRRRKVSGTGDLIDLILQGDRLHHVGWRYNVLSIFLAGYETSAVALAWIWYLLSRHPEAAAKMQAEVDRVIGGRLPSETDLRALVYTEAVMKEALRLYPPIWMTGREAREDLTLGSIHVPAGSILIISPWVTHRDPRFHVDPNAFRPERWLLPESGQPPRYAYFPFSGGPRSCLAQRFATVEIMLAVAMIATRFTLTSASQTVVMPKPRIGLRPAGAVLMKVTRRES